MGSWGYKTFEDDTACDWIGAFKESPNLRLVEVALDAAVNARHIDDILGAGALAAAEVAAALNGRPPDRLPPEVSAWVSWVSAQAPIRRDLLVKASSAVSKVFQRSELREVWEDAGSVTKWQVAVEELQSRLVPR